MFKRTNDWTWRIVATYLIISILWILFSDQLVSIITDASSAFTTLQTIKGWFFVVASSLLLLILLTRANYQQKMMLEELTQIQQRFLDLFENNPTPMWVYDQETLAFLAVNRAAIGVYEYSSEAFLQMDTPRLCPPEDLPRLKAAMQEQPTHITQNQGIWRLQKKSGAIIEAEVTAQQLTFNGREAVLVAAMDVTALQMAERASQAAELRYKAIIETSSVSITISDLETSVFTDVNPAFTDILGYTREEVIGKSAVALDLWVDIAERARLVQQLMAQHSLRNQEVRFRRKNGDIIVALVSFSLMEENDRQYILSILLDITDQKKAEQAVRNLSRFPEENPNPVLRVDPSGKVLYANHSAKLILLDYGKAAESTLPEEMIQAAVAAYNQGSAGIFYSRAAEKYYEFAISPIVQESYINLYGRDITEQVAAQQELQQAHDELERRVIERTIELERRNQQLIAVNAELEAFAYSASHDLRAPLRRIDGFSMALAEDLKEKVSTEGLYYLDRIRSNTQRMGVLIDDLLVLSRVARAEINLRTVDLSELCTNIIADLQQREPDRKVEVEILPAMKITADDKLMNRALVNLLENAWKFTRKTENAKIRVGSNLIESGQMVYYVSDNGAGFDMAYADKLFIAFQRLHAEHDYEGTGIGLAIVRRVIHRHGGRIWAESEVGKGATFFFTLS